MTPGLPYGRGSYKGSDNYQNQQESYALRREILSKKNGWVVRPGDYMMYADNTTHTQNLFSLARLPIYNNSFALSQVRLRSSSAAAGAKCHTGLYVWVPSPVRAFRLISSSVKIFDVAASGLHTYDFKNPVTINANEQYFSGAFCAGGSPQLLTGLSQEILDEAVRTLSGVTALPNVIPLSRTTATYTQKIILPSYYSAQAAEVV